MAVCEHYRIPHSHFLGGPLVWSERDQHKAIVYRLRQAEACASCGTRRAEWDPGKGGSPEAYKTVEVHCPGCEKRDKAESRIEEKERGFVTIQLRRNSRAPRPRER